VIGLISANHSSAAGMESVGTNAGPRPAGLTPCYRAPF